MHIYTYCPACGHSKTMNRDQGDLKQCKACGAKWRWHQLNRARIKAEPTRLLVAIKHLGSQNAFTRLEIARHLDMSKSTYLITKLEQLVCDGRLRAWLGDHPQNNRTTVYYRRRNQ